MFLYVVQCTFGESAAQTRDLWLDWLQTEHIDEVIQSGADSAELFKLDGDPESFQIHYRFASRANFEKYEREQAPRLREEGLQKFPLQLGLSYQRFSGELIHR